MSRPSKQGLSYFPFDVDFFSDEKIGAISGEFGIKGEITTVKLLCAIYRNGYFILWDEALKMKLLKDLPGISLELLDRIVIRLVKWGFFEQDLFDSVKVLTSEAIQERYFEAIKRRKTKEAYPHLLVNVDINPINVCNNPINVCNNPQRKGNKREETSLTGGKEDCPPPDPCGQPLGLCRAGLEANAAWREAVTMNTRAAGFKDFTPGDFDRYLDAFFAKLQNEGTTRKSPRDAMSHFARWLRIELEKQQRQAHETNRNAHTSKQEANDYAFALLQQHRRELDQGLEGTLERPF